MDSRDSPVHVERVILAPHDQIFEVLATPARHQEIGAHGIVVAPPRGPSRLSAGAVFSVTVRQAGIDVESDNVVIEFEEGQRITWTSDAWVRRRRVLGGQLWRFLLFPQAGPTLVRHEHEWAHARNSWALRLVGHHRRVRPSMIRTMQGLEQAVRGDVA